jgi:hypothetical protein
VRRDPGDVERRGSPLPLRATSIVLALWITGLVILAFVVVPALFATCGPPNYPSGGPPL